jgi:hypothetical protein
MRERARCMATDEPTNGGVFGKKLLGQSLGELDQNASIRRVLDFPESHDEPQSFDDIEIDFIVPKQLEQFVAGLIGIISAHAASSRRE